MSPELTNHPLIRADGSATHTTSLFTILAAVNGPIEVQRRDELPEEAAIEVNIRPCAGIGGPRERWLESVLAALLKSVLLVHVHPRTLMQVTLQVLKEPSSGVRVRRRLGDVAVLPALVNAAFAACVDAGLPLGRTVVAGLAVVREDGDGVVVDPDEKALAGCRSVHAMGFDALGELLLNESGGQFDLRQWHDVFAVLKTTAAVAIAPTGEDEAMMNGDGAPAPWLRQALEGNAREAGAWRGVG